MSPTVRAALRRLVPPSAAAAALAIVAQAPPLRAGLVGLEPGLAPILFCCGLLVGGGAWVARLRFGRDGWRRWLRTERRLLRHTTAWWIAAACLFAAPVLAHLDFQPTGRIASFAAQLGHLPWGDCSGHVGGANRLLAEGAFGAFSERRPMGAAWLSVTLGLSGESLARALLLQAFLLGSCALLAARAAAARFGLGAAPMLLGLTLGVARDYAPTASTEPLGLMLACLAVALLGSRGALARPGLAALGVFALAAALNARPGAQLVLPALFVWGVAVAPGSRWRAIGRLAAAILAASALTVSLNALHGAGQSGFSTSPAYALYGLTRNANYRQVARDFPQELERLSERELAPFLYERAFGNLREDPRPFFAALLGNVRKFLAKAPETLQRAISLRWLAAPSRERANPGADEVERDRRDGGWLLLLGALGFVWHLRAAGTRAEAALWTAFAGGLLVSAMFVFGEAGTRSLTPAVPFAALALSMAASTGRERPRSAGAEGLRVRIAAAAALCLCAACVLGPYAARAVHAGPSAGQVAGVTTDGAGGETLVADLGRAPAVLIVPALGPPERRPQLPYEEMRFLLDVGDFGEIQALAAQRAPFALASAYDIGRRRQLLLVSTRQLLREVDGLALLTVEPLGRSPELRRVVSWEPWPRSTRD